MKSEQKTDEEVRNVLLQSESQKLISQNQQSLKCEILEKENKLLLQSKKDLHIKILEL